MPGEPPDDFDAIPSELNPSIIYQDDAILVINKPAGLLSLPDGYDRDSLHLAKVLERTLGQIWIVHRLDRDTSGVMIVARSAEAHRQVNTQFQERNTRKVYHTLVIGNPTWDNIQVNAPLRVNGDRRHRTVIDLQAGKPAATHFDCVEQFKQFSLIQAQPHSGYTHQIRAHLAYLGFPILADTLYGKKTEIANLQNIVINRVALHAYSLELIHPTTGQLMSFTAPYPSDFRSQIEVFRNRSLG